MTKNWLGPGGLGLFVNDKTGLGQVHWGFVHCQNGSQEVQELFVNDKTGLGQVYGEGACSLEFASHFCGPQAHV